jgi:pimeloyl-ACP methyl ester carboxylesterase
MTETVKAAFWLSTERPIFTIYQGPVGASRDLGIVLCNSLGHEMMCLHRAYRHLAERLAAAGYPTLRFDYDGTGDSSGGDDDADRAVAWLASIDQAVQALLRKGITRVALVGVRFGALLAAAYAEAKPVDTLVLVAPPTSGRAYLRELRALHAIRLGHLTDAASGVATDGQELVGYRLNAKVLRYLEELPPVRSRLARRALVVSRDDLPGYESRLVERLTGLGVDAELSQTPGYAASMTDADPVKALVPDAIWDKIAGWLGDVPRGPAGEISFAFEPRSTHLRSHDTGAPMLEQIVDVDGMFGILTTPVRGPAPGAPLVVLNNVGANHHVGCNRIYVEFARHWGALGFSSLRLDLAGIGDTRAGEGRKENAVYSEGAVDDVRRAIDWLANTKSWDRFILAGVCSGAYVSYYAALDDARVQGVVLMNPLTFHWREGDSLDVKMRTTLKSTHFYRRAALQVDTWKRAIRGEVDVRSIARQIGQRTLGRIKRWPSQWLRQETDVALGFRRLCSRGARVLLVCGEDDGSCDVIAEHLGPDAERFRHVPNFRFTVISHTDHTFAPHAARSVVLDRLTDYLNEDQVAQDPSSSRIPASRRIAELLRSR